MLHAWSDWNDDGQLEDQLQSARRALSLFQHHDGITGTARDYVVKDYERQMMEALRSCKFVIQQAVYRHLTKPNVSFHLQFTRKNRLISVCFFHRSTSQISNLRISTLTIHVQLA